MSDQTATVYVVDDAELELRSICDWLAEVGIETVPLRSSSEFVFECRTDCPVVAVLDMQMTLSGEDTYKVLRKRGLGWVPTIFVSNTGDIDVVARTLQAGAMGFFSKKPENKAPLQAMVREAIKRAQDIYVSGRRDGMKSPIGKLTDQEIKAWALWAKEGLTQAEAAERMGVSVQTVNTYRFRMCAKLGVTGGARYEHITDQFGNLDFEAVHSSLQKKGNLS